MYLAKVLLAAREGKQLIGQILDFSRQRPAEHRMVDLAVVVAEAVEFLLATIPTTIEIRYRVEEDLGGVRADTVQLHEAIMNLGTNAAHAIGGETGRMDIVLEAERVNEARVVRSATLAPGNYVKLTVADTGCGMDETTLERIFDPYFTTKLAGEGTGFGLAAVPTIIAGHGDAIDVASTSGRGTTFVIYLPVAEAPRDGSAIATDGSADRPGGQGGQSDSAGVAEGPPSGPSHHSAYRPAPP